MAENAGLLTDWASPPGDTINDILDERRLSVVGFAKQIDQSAENAKQMINGQIAITVELARRLESVLGASAAFWLARESQYRDDLVRLEAEEHAANEVWLKDLPIKDMINLGWVDRAASTSEQLAKCLQFFGVPDVATWRVRYDPSRMATFRTSSSFDSKLSAVSAWLRQGEIASSAIECKKWDSARFQNALLEIRPLTRESDPKRFLPELVRLCAECGVGVAIVRAPTGCRASGATRFLSPTRALLLLSFRYLSDDHFWFTFFHEAGHLLLHGKKALFLEGTEMLDDEKEQQANEFAARTLIPGPLQAELMELGPDPRAVIRFARKAGVSRGVVVGQLQHCNLIRKNQLNKLKVRFIWTDG